jgi:hypothetical protein
VLLIGYQEKRDYLGNQVFVFGKVIVGSDKGNCTLLSRACVKIATGTAYEHSSDRGTNEPRGGRYVFK